MGKKADRRARRVAAAQERDRLAEERREAERLRIRQQRLRAEEAARQAREADRAAEEGRVAAALEAAADVSQAVRAARADPDRHPHRRLATHWALASLALALSRG